MQAKNNAAFNALTNKAEGFDLYCDIGQNRFTAANITHMAVFGSLIDKPCVGNCIVRQIEITATVTNQTIPRMANIEPFASIGQNVIKKGKFYIDTRKKETGIDDISFVGYDSMLKAEVDFLPAGSTWVSKSIAECISIICTDIGVTLDSRVTSSAAYNAVKNMMVGFPNADTEGITYSDREMLGYFGAAMGGNWYITDENNLMLAPLKTVNADTVALGVKAENLVIGQQLTAITKLIMNTSSESAVFAWKTGSTIVTSTTDPGWETMDGVIEVDYPLAMGADTDIVNIAKNILGQVYGYVHKPYSATETELDIRAELGDDVTINNNTFTLFTINTDFDYCLSEINCPEYGETDSEYPYKSPTIRKFDRKVRDLNTKFTVEIGRVESEISGKITTYRQATVPTNPNTGDLWYATADVEDYHAGTWYRYNGTSWDETSETVSIPVAPAWETATAYKKGDVVDDGGKWYAAKLDHTASSANKPPNATYWEERQTISQVTNSQITQMVDGIELSVSSGSSGTKISMQTGGITIDSPLVDMHVKALNVDGNFTADKIKTGTLDADDITLDGKLQVKSGQTQGGYIGYGYGNDGDSDTNGVVLASASEQSYGSGDYYVIVTNGGVRMTAGTNSVYCTGNGVYKVVNGVHTEIGEAVFG